MHQNKMLIANHMLCFEFRNDLSKCIRITPDMDKNAVADRLRYLARSIESEDLDFSERGK